MARLVIFGAGHARLAHHYFTTDTSHEVAGFIMVFAWLLPLSDAEDAAARYPPSEYAMFVALSYAKMNALRATNAPP